MSISYSAVFPKRHVTLPSVEMWGTNMNILKEPKKSIMTRRKDRTGQINLSSIIQDGTRMAGDRIAENILVYGRGLNITKVYGDDKDRPKQTYQLETDGAFRPPVLRQEQLMPLSRQPRTWTQSYSNPGFVNFSKRFNCNPSKRAIIQDTNKIEVAPNAVYKTNFVTREPYQVKHVISNPVVANNVSSGVKYMNITEQTNQTPMQNINENYTSAYAQTNQTSNRMNNNRIESYQTPLQLRKPNASATTNISQSQYTRMIEPENSIELNRNKPIACATTNVTHIGDTTVNNSREYYLPEQINKGGFHQRGNFVPTYEQVVNTNKTLSSTKLNLKKQAHQQFLERK